MTVPREKLNGHLWRTVIPILVAALITGATSASLYSWSQTRTQEVRIDAQERKLAGFEKTMKEFSVAQSAMAATLKGIEVAQKQEADNIRRLLDRAEVKIKE